MKIKLFIFGVLFLVGIFIWYSTTHQASSKLAKQQAVSKNTSQQVSFTPRQLQQYYASYKDPYVIALRTGLNGYLDGTNKGMNEPQLIIASNRRDGYIDGFSSFSKDYYKSKFIVYAIDNSLTGGKQMAIIFQNKPDKMFDAWVYKLADGSYDLRGFSQDLKYTSDKMKTLQSEYKTFLDDSIHAM